MKTKKDLTDEQILKEHGEDNVESTKENGEASQNEQETTGDGEEQLTKEEEELQTKYLRLAADFQNYKRRVEKEKNDIYAYANEKLMVELLNVIDNFDRALAVESIDAGMKEGMLLIFKQLINVLEKCGLEEVSAEGQDFDPNCHHAVQTENSDAHCNGQITKVLQKGYTLNKKVIRPSMVIVAE